MIIKPSPEQVHQMHVTRYLEDTGKIHKLEVLSGECFPDCKKCEMEK